LIEPEEEARGECDGGQEGVHASIISGADAPPVLEPSKHVLDALPLTTNSGKGRRVRLYRMLLQFDPSPLKPWLSQPIDFEREADSA
jgi:hypothetical protein